MVHYVLGVTSLKVICAFLLMGSLQGIAAGVIGDPPVLRETTDTFSGYLFAYDGNFALDGLVTSWSFYAGSASNADVAGHQLTPVIMDQSDPDGWVITGIGATRTVLAAGFYACRSRRKTGPFWRVKWGQQVGYGPALGRAEEQARAARAFYFDTFFVASASAAC
jgi:hypothetical protein